MLRLARRRVWIISVGPLGPKSIILALYKDLGVMPLLACFMCGIHGRTYGGFLGLVWTIMFLVVADFPFALMKDDEVLRSRHLFAPRQGMEPKG